jgi:hypothetical protein
VLVLVASVEASATEAVVVSEAVTAVASAGDLAASVAVTEVDSVAATEVASVEHHVADTEVSIDQIVEL